MFTTIMLCIVSFVIGAFLALVWVSRDKSLVVLKDDETLIKKDELTKLVKGYAYAVKKIDPDLLSEL
jgi:hypothetical protein